jgi:hypothetical protein
VGTPPTRRDSRATRLTSSQKTAPAGTPGHQAKITKDSGQRPNGLLKW